ncbi:P-II family nitrogen regulator [Klebsiella pneumoniae]|jgi:nitrogen regulatory protein PII|uniref:Nitrogen fixation nifHD region glnB 2 n=1 Tax=Clostridium butyricum TaxID=1492 RepID=A0A3R9DKF3_CLOBU|nr:P-II family nitrogen regulator [Clostridium butyricum]MBS2904480.1 P-II family nitrogen regulator [Klebsiella pneumoniae]ALP91414.1 transcriptional regulator [Clostridium butyricum]ALS17910.1 transcriptional regulator [Clostridium butyricum]ANF15035.1 transcriptional regulator [Clostridium butyricum]AOR95044.1 transcriptional regulator [Clostridium butyricum]
MKQIIAIIRPKLYFKTKDALSENRFFAMSTKEVLGRGRKNVDFTANEGNINQKNIYNDTLIAKKMIEIIVRDNEVDKVVDIIMSVNKSNSNGDGKIFIIPVEDSIRIHTGEKGEEALM